jgi:DNA repair exonuclease SbcCD ATPase subunit
MDSHLREYNENTITCENYYYMKNKSFGDIQYNRQEIEEDLRENYRDFIDEKKSILNTFSYDASELKEDLENDLKNERNYYMSERQQILQNDDSWERFKELNKLEKEYKNNIKEIKEGYYQSLRNLRERRDDNLRDNENDYNERKRNLNNKKRELEEYNNNYNNYMMNKSNIEYNYSIKMQNANNEFVNNIEMLRLNLTNELNTLEREFNEQLNKPKMFYSQNNNMR